MRIPFFKTSKSEDTIFIWQVFLVGTKETIETSLGENIILILDALSLPREAIPQKNLFLFGHCQNHLDPPPSPPAVLDTYEELCRKKIQLFNSASNNLDSGLTPPLDNVQIEAVFLRDCFPYQVYF